MHHKMSVPTFNLFIFFLIENDEQHDNLIMTEKMKKLNKNKIKIIINK